jgi:hypothetical protein
MSKELRDALRSLVKPNNDGFAKVCTVDSIDLDKLICYCIPLNGDADLVGVRLMANIDNGFLLIPEVNSIVVVSFLSDDSAYVSLVSKVSEVNLNGKNFDGLVKVNDLVEKLNNLENKVNTIISIYNAHTHVASSLGTPTTTPVAPVTGTLTPTIKADLENTTILQGDGS